MISRSLLLVFFIVLSIGAAAQQRGNPDSLFEQARKSAFDNKDYAKAISLGRQTLIIAPNYTDILVFIGRIHTWNKQPDSAKGYFAQALQQKPNYEDAYAAYTDLNYWNGWYDSALTIVNKGLSYKDTSRELLIRKAKVLYAKKEFRDAYHIADTLLQLNNADQDARALCEAIKSDMSLNKIGISFDYVYFDKQFPDPWRLASLEYTRSTHYGPLTFRINYANRFKMDGMQYEAESYPHFSKRYYGYLNLGYSDGATIFPKWRAGASLYANLPHAYEAEAGMRYLFFTSSTWIYTAYIGKYYKSFLFGARTYLVPDVHIQESYSVLARYYYKGADDYIGLIAGTGISPDDRRYNVLYVLPYKVQTYRAELNLRHAFGLNIIALNGSILNEEYRPGVTGNQVQGGIAYIRRF